MVWLFKNQGLFEARGDIARKGNLGALAIVPSTEAEELLRERQDVKLLLGYQTSKRRCDVWVRSHNQTFAGRHRQTKMMEGSGTDEGHRVAPAERARRALRELFQRFQ
jgi:hypothetical protein